MTASERSRNVQGIGDSAVVKPRQAKSETMTNIAVSLYSVAGATTNLVASTTTDASGNYSLQAAPGNYVLRVDAPDGYAFSPKQASGGTAETDSDFGTNHPYSELLTIFSGDYLLNLDAGLVLQNFQRLA